MKNVYDNTTIECASAEVISRKIVYSSYIEIKDVGRCFTYKCSRNSEAHIRVELNPKVPKYNEFSLLDKDDSIQGYNLFVAVNKKKPIKPDLINFSGRHKAQTFRTIEYTMAKITRQLDNIPKLHPPKSIKLIN